jgi:hypothetical protein
MTGYSEGREEKNKEKEKEKNKRMGWSTASFLFFSPQAPSVMWRIETCVIPGPRSSLEEQRAFSVNLDEAPHPVTGVEGVKQLMVTWAVRGLGSIVPSYSSLWAAVVA